MYRCRVKHIYEVDYFHLKSATLHKEGYGGDRAGLAFRFFIISLIQLGCPELEMNKLKIGNKSAY